MRKAALISFLVLAMAACGNSPVDSGDSPGPAPTQAATTASSTTSSADGAAKAKEIFATRCTPCHGPEGRGDGPASQSLDPRPRNFHDHNWHASVDDAHIEQIIKFGGAAVGKSPAMPGNPDLSDPVVVAELKNVIRGFNKQD
jgi:mono/diheme cytochrome c family protein